MKAGAGKRKYVLCGRCGRTISERVGGGPVAHMCLHARTCVAPAWRPLDPNFHCETCAKSYPQTQRAPLVTPKGGAA